MGVVVVVVYLTSLVVDFRSEYAAECSEK